MPTTNAVLGQVKPLAATPTQLYVSTGIESLCSTIVVANQSATTATSFRVSVRVAAAVDDTKQYLYWDVPIAPNDTFCATIGITLGSNDQVYVYAGHATLSFNLFGVKIT